MAGERTSRGLLFLVVGPSGSGKDSLIQGAQASLRGEGGFVFARRVITRAADAGGEDHIPASTDDFERQARDGAFLLHWRANGHAYGLPRGLEDQRRAGRHVVANVSRTVVGDARGRLAPVHVIRIHVPQDELARRLAARGRETAGEIRARLERAAAFDVVGEDVSTVENTGSLPATVERFVAVLTSRHLLRGDTAPTVETAKHGPPV